MYIQKEFAFIFESGVLFQQDQMKIKVSTFSVNQKITYNLLLIGPRKGLLILNLKNETAFF